MDLPAAIAPLGERQTEDLEFSGSIPDRGMFNVTVYILRLFERVEEDLNMT